jgi:hypothetical protein
VKTAATSGNQEEGSMATRTEDTRVRGVSARPRGVDETKAAFKTTEFMAYVATVVAVLIASAIDDGIDGRLAWILVTALTVGYMLSRGFAKSGSRHREGNDTI